MGTHPFLLSPRRDGLSEALEFGFWDEELTVRSIRLNTGDLAR